MKTIEANFDGLVGPTHNYAGLSSGNIASTKNAKETSKPKEAALQGLAKAFALSQMGLVQGILAPHLRPDFLVLKRLGFSGSEKDIIAKAFKASPLLVAACYSASAMWTANAATVSPSADTADGKIHFTPANLCSKFHRSLEPELTGKILKATFANSTYFTHHTHLPKVSNFADEGAANHTRFCTDYNEKGVEFFVYGRHSFQTDALLPKKYEARQTYEASLAISRLHGLDPKKCVFAQQNPNAIDGGVFHNDVISVGNQNVYFFHEQALLEKEKTLEEIQQKMGNVPLFMIEVPKNRVTLQDAVSSYLFNSQLVTLGPKHMAIIVPEECRQNKNVWNYLQEVITQKTPLKEVKVFNVTESMQNGGGPACLRLRVVLNEAEKNAVNPKTMLTPTLYTELTKWVQKHYRDSLAPADLADPLLIDEVKTALDELTQIMNLGSIYSFQ